MPPAKAIGDLPGVEGKGVSQPKIPAVTKAAKKYLEIRDARMELTKQEVDTKAVLLNAMEENGLHIYYFDDHYVEITDKKSLKIKSVDDPDENAGGEPE